MDFFTAKDHPLIDKSMEEIKEQNKLNVDEYTKFKKPLTPMQSFYAGKSVFFTGATGFIGICFVEKVLRDCSDIKKLYLLVRPGKSGSLQDRLQKYFSNFVFDRVRKINPNFENKIVAIKGDLAENDLGLSAEDRQLLIDNVDIMVHNGASVKFKQRISVALKINVLGTKNMLELALACKHMKAFVYVSTAYSHNYRHHIEEKFYEPAVDIQVVHDIIAADEATKDGLSKESANSFFGKWLIVYTFTKSISEDLVRQCGEKANFACSVYRPSMVTGAYHEPCIGWIGNSLGPNILFLSSALGALHASFETDQSIDLVPVDYSVNALIACIYDTARHWNNDRRPKVYNFASGMANPIIVRRVYNTGRDMLPSFGLNAAVWHISTILTSNKWLFFFLHFFLHFIPAAFVDAALLVMGKKPRALSICIAATKNIDWIIHFATYGWRIQISEMRKVFDSIGEADRKLFDFDIWSMSWDDYLSKMILGYKIYLMKEPMDKRGKRRFILLRTVHYIFLAVINLVFAYYLLKLFNVTINYLFLLPITALAVSLSMSALFSVL